MKEKKFRSGQEEDCGLAGGGAGWDLGGRRRGGGSLSFPQHDGAHWQRELTAVFNFPRNNVEN